MITKLVARIYKGPDHWLRDERSGILVVRVRNHLIVYRHGERKLWVDLHEQKILNFSIRTEAETRAFNKVLGVLGLSARYKFMRSSRMVLLAAEGTLYRSDSYEETHSPFAVNTK